MEREIDFPAGATVSGMNATVVYPGRISHQGPFSPKRITVERDKPRWAGDASLALERAGTPVAQEIELFYARLNGSINRFELPLTGRPPVAFLAAYNGDGSLARSILADGGIGYRTGELDPAPGQWFRFRRAGELLERTYMIDRVVADAVNGALIYPLPNAGLPDLAGGSVEIVAATTIRARMDAEDYGAPLAQWAGPYSFAWQEAVSS